MRVLIVEDDGFNAFCLTALLRSSSSQIQVSVVDNSVSAMDYLLQYTPSFVILDGFLRSDNVLHCDGPALANIIWSSWPGLTIVAWTSSDVMREAFAEVFKKHAKPFDDNYCWTKIVSQDRVSQFLAWHGDCSGETDDVPNCVSERNRPFSFQFAGRGMSN